MMNSSKQLKLDIISKLNLKKISIEDAKIVLGVSERTVLRYLKAFSAQGPLFVNHGNEGRSPPNKGSPEDIEKAVQLMKEKYFDFNLTHALEKLIAEDGIKINRETFRKVCHEIGMVKKSHKRRSKVRKARERVGQEGVMLQMDGSPHRWFGGKTSCLISAIDDATGEVYDGEFFESETTIGCMKVLKTIIERKGFFSILYVDRAGIFGGPKRVNFSQVKRALLEVGIHIIFANSPQAKGRIERLWGTLQDRLVPEMRLRKIKSYEAANDFLKNQYLPNEHNKRYKVLAKNIEPAWRKVSDKINLNEIFCIKDHRIVKNDHTYSWNGVQYKITSEFKYSIQNQKIEIRTYIDGTWKVFFADKELTVVQHHMQPRLSVVESVKLIESPTNAYTVRKDSHIEYKGKFYSVAAEYIKKVVTVSEQENQILIYYRRRLIESHTKISNHFTKSSTKEAHMGPWKKTLEKGSVYRKAAMEIGPYCDKMICVILQRGNGVVDNKSIWGIINFQKSYNRLSIEEACKTSYKLETCTYRSVANILSLKYTKQKVS